MACRFVTRSASSWADKGPTLSKESRLVSCLADAPGQEVPKIQGFTAFLLHSQGPVGKPTGNSCHLGKSKARQFVFFHVRKLLSVLKVLEQAEAVHSFSFKLHLHEAVI